jgi:hypothetical protein
MREAVITVRGVTWATPPKSLPVPSEVGRFSGCSTDSQGQAAIGALWSYDLLNRWVESEEWDLTTSPIAGSLKWTCLHPPAYRDDVATCPVTLTATISLRDNPLASLNGKIKSAATSTPFSRSRALKDCGAGSWTLSLKTPLAAWGRYSARAQSTAVSGTVRTFLGPDPRTGAVPAPRVVGGWSAPFVVAPATAKAQSSCLATTSTWVWARPDGRSFTFDTRDCPPAKTPVKCIVGGTPILVWTDTATRKTQRIRGAGEIVDDGRRWEAQWPTPRVTGAAKVYNQTTTLTRTGTPWRGGKPLALQPFVADVGVTKTGLVNGPWAHAWQAASDAKAPTVTALTYKVDGDWRTTVGVIESVDAHTGAVTLGSRVGTVRATAQCTSDPLTVSVLRARLSN